MIEGSIKKMVSPEGLEPLTKGYESCLVSTGSI